MMEMPPPVWPEPRPGESTATTYLPPLPEPLVLDGHWRDHTHKVAGFTAWQMRQYGESCARMAREEAAKVCEHVHATTGECPEMALYCAEAIRKG